MHLRCLRLKKFLKFLSLNKLKSVTMMRILDMRRAQSELSHCLSSGYHGDGNVEVVGDDVVTQIVKVVNRDVKDAINTDDMEPNSITVNDNTGIMETVNLDAVEVMDISDNDDVFKPSLTQSVILDKKHPFETPIDVSVRSDLVKQFKKWAKNWKTNKK